jgi:hypothetical protein
MSVRSGRPRRPLRAAALGIALLALPCLPAAEAEEKPPPQELGAPLAALDSVSARNGYVTKSENVLYDGAPAAYAVYEGGGSNGFARGIAHVDWRVDDEVVYAASFLLPEGFHDRIQGQVDIMRWDNWPSHREDADWGGISIWESDRRARLLRFGASRADENVIGAPFGLPEGRWFRLTVRQQLTPRADAFSAVRLDDEVVSWGAAATTYGRPIERMRFGLVAIAGGAQQRPLELFMADPEVRPVGPDPSPPWQAAVDDIVDVFKPLAPSRWLEPILEKIRYLRTAWTF